MRAVTSSSATRCAQVIVQAERGARNGKVAAPPLQAGKPDKRDPARATVGQSNAPKLNMFTRDYFGYQWSVAPLTSGKRRACLPVPGWLHVGSDAPARLLLPRCPQRCWTHLQGGWWTTPCCWSARCGMCRGRRGAPADSAPPAGQPGAAARLGQRLRPDPCRPWARQSTMRPVGRNSCSITC